MIARPDIFGLAAVCLCLWSLTLLAMVTLKHPGAGAACLLLLCAAVACLVYVLVRQ